MPTQASARETDGARPGAAPEPWHLAAPEGRADTATPLVTAICPPCGMSEGHRSGRARSAGGPASRRERRSAGVRAGVSGPPNQRARSRGSPTGWWGAPLVWLAFRSGLCPARRGCALPRGRRSTMRLWLPRATWRPRSTPGEALSSFRQAGRATAGAPCRRANGAELVAPRCHRRRRAGGGSRAGPTLALPPQERGYGRGGAGRGGGARAG